MPELPPKQPDWNELVAKVFEEVEQRRKEQMKSRNLGSEEEWVSG